MDMFLGIFMFIWIIVGVVALIISVVGLCMNIGYASDKEDTRFWARLVLASFVWPFVLPAAIYWVVCKAFDRHFPSFTKEV